MILFQFLRALVDLGFYYSVAGTFSTAAGGRLALAAFLLQSACFALSFALRRRRFTRMAALLPSLLLFLPPAAAADMLVCIPPLLYLVYLTWTDNFQLSWFRQTDIFRVFCRVFLGAAIFLPMLGLGRALLSAGIPAALVAAAASVLLMRSLRHDPAVYLQPRYQAANAAGIALTAALALVIGSEQVVRAGLFLLGTLYNRILAPLLLGLFTALGTVILLFLPLLQWFVGFVVHHSDQDSGALAENGDALQEQLAQNLAASSSGLIWQGINALALLLVIAILLKLFVWMAQRHTAAPAGTAAAVQGILPGAAPQRPGREGGSSYARRIRRQYRAFLRLCRKQGITLRSSDTSTDVGAKAFQKFPDEASLSALRDLYQEARYHGASSREDYLKFQQLLKRVKKLPAPLS